MYFSKKSFIGSEHRELKKQSFHSYAWECNFIQKRVYKKIPFKLVTIHLILFAETKDLCQQPNVVNGHVTVVTDTNNVFSGSVECDNGYTLVGRDRIKCRNGIWSSSTPVCTRKWTLISLGTPLDFHSYFHVSDIGSCEVRDLPEVKNARRIMVRPYRGSVVRFKCRRGYHLFGPRLFHCVDHKEWSHLEAPVCVSKYQRHQSSLPKLFY